MARRSERAIHAASEDRLRVARPRVGVVLLMIYFLDPLETWLSRALKQLRCDWRSVFRNARRPGSAIARDPGVRALVGGNLTGHRASGQG